MPRVVLRLGAVGWMIAAAVVGVAPTVARADAPGAQGWWTVSNPGGLPANPAAAQADVPGDGLLVQAGPVNPTAPCNCTAYAGLVYELTDGFTASDLTLKVAPHSATTPVAKLELCVLVNPGLNTEQGGPLTDAPDYDCTKHATASLGAGGSSFTFHVGSLVSNGILAVAILPGDSTSRVVLSKPDTSSLATAPSTSSTGSSFPSTPSGGTSTTTKTGGATSGGGSTSATAPAPAPALQLPQPSAVGQSDTGQTPVIAPSPSAPAATLAAAPVAAESSTSSGSKPVAVVLLLAGLAAGAALWAMAGRGAAGGVADA